jgi:hypothetical protein
LVHGVTAAPKIPQINVKKEFNLAVQQYEGMLSSHPDLTKFPQSTKPNGMPNDRESSWWCSGFFGGSLWYIYEFTGDINPNCPLGVYVNKTIFF